MGLPPVALVQMPWVPCAAYVLNRTPYLGPLWADSGAKHVSRKLQHDGSTTTRSTADCQRVTLNPIQRSYGEESNEETPIKLSIN